MRLKEITQGNSTYLSLAGKEKLSIGPYHHRMLSLYDAIKTGQVPKSIWLESFQKFNAALDEASH